MTHIEFIGAPGAGKSTGRSELTSRNEWLYGAEEREAIRRRFGGTADPKFRLLYRLLPKSVRSVIEDACLRHRYLRSDFLDFVEGNPGFLRTVADVVDPAERTYWLFSLCRYAAERYQMGVSTVGSEETLCLDENFHHYGAHVLFETSLDPDPADLAAYFEMAPTPEVLVHVDAPGDRCLTRQQDRGDDGSALPQAEHAVDEFSSPLEAQEKYRRACSLVAEYLGRVTSVVRVENTGTVEECTAEVEAELARIDPGRGPPSSSGERTGPSGRSTG